VLIDLMKMKARLTPLIAGVLTFTSTAAPVHWADWTSGTAGWFGSAEGQIDTGSEIVGISYTGEIAFIQTSGGINYWNPSAPYTSVLVDNGPGTPDIIAVSKETTKTLSFSKPVDNLFLAVVSLNNNGYLFNQDFSVVSYGQGYWGDGTLIRTDLGGGQFMLSGSEEPHGVIRFAGPVSSISWTGQTDEYWNGFTVGTYGVASTFGLTATATPDHGSSGALLGLGFLVSLVVFRRAGR
jgi:hypothetical protein